MRPVWLKLRKLFGDWVSRRPAYACWLSRTGATVGGVTIWSDAAVDHAQVLQRAYAFLSAKVESDGWGGSSLQRIEQANS
jgi:hypothetical protein